MFVIKKKNNGITNKSSKARFVCLWLSATPGCCAVVRVYRVIVRTSILLNKPWSSCLFVKKKNVEETDENFPWLTIKPVNGIPRLILVIVPHEREPSRIPSPAREEASSSKKKKNDSKSSPQREVKVTMASTCGRAGCRCLRPCRIDRRAGRDRQP